MTTSTDLKATKKLLTEHHQSHLLAFWTDLAPAEKRNLLAQIEQLDLTQIDRWVANFIRQPPSAPILTDVTPASSYSPEPAGIHQERRYAKAIALGKELISAGKVAALVVAGGQGTRLGFDGPKGDFPISPVKNKTLFQLFAETIAAASEKYQTTCSWYVMTSPLNHAETLEIFDGHDYYGLDRRAVFIFKQSTLPSLDFDGRILLADKANISRSPDGHGGTLKALCQSGALEDMKKCGIEFISYFQVDNPLVKIFDPLFIGLHAFDEAEMSSKALLKTGSKEKVGNFCLVDGKVTVIEYSDLPDELAEKKNADGSLAFQLGSIAIHIISTSFVERLNTEVISLPLHRAIKRIPHISQEGQPVKPTEPNGVKLETFIFDALPLASKSIILETIRSQEFAPVKNPSGVDSPETARKLMIGRAADWLESAGVTIPRKPDGSPDCLIEIAPSFALDKDDVKAKLGQIPRINPGDKVYLT